ncbi:MAG: hypothetical protein RJB66_1784 [Pseudomonadota bacterium]
MIHKNKHRMNPLQRFSKYILFIFIFQALPLFAGYDDSESLPMISETGAWSDESTEQATNEYLYGDQREEPVIKRKRTVLTEKQKEDIRKFYNQRDFPQSDLMVTLKSRTKLASATATLSEAKELLPDPCDKVVDQVANAVRNNVSSVHLNRANDLNKVCPNWSKLSTDQKKDFYVALVGAMAMAESSCNNKIKAKGTNSTAYGLWQGTKKRSPTDGAVWVMDQLESQISKSGKVFWENSKLNYWAVLNPNLHAYKVQRLLKRIPTCVNKLMTADLY